MGRSCDRRMAKFDESVENTAGMRFAPKVTICVGAAVTAVSRNAPARLRVMVVELYILRWLLMSSFRGELSWRGRAG